MLDYLISLLDDSNGFSWTAAKARHALLLCRMEQEEITDYVQTDLINRVRKDIVPSIANPNQNAKKPQKTQINVLYFLQSGFLQLFGYS